MKLKFTKEEMILLNAICDIEVSADGTKTYSMKPTIITDEGYTDIETVSAFELASENKSLSGPSINSHSLKEEGFITTDIVDRRDASSLSDIVSRLSEMRCTSPDFHPLRKEEDKFLSDPSIDFKFKDHATKIIDEKEALCRDNSFEISILRERAKKDAFFDTMIKDGIKVGMAVHLYDMMYGVSEIDHVNKKITLRRGDNQLFDYFELLKSNQ